MRLKPISSHKWDIAPATKNKVFNTITFELVGHRMVIPYAIANGTVITNHN